MTATSTPTAPSAAPPGWAYRARNCIPHIASSQEMPRLTRGAGTSITSPASTTDTITENASAIHAAMASRGARSGQRARASTGAPAVSSSAA